MSTQLEALVNAHGEELDLALERLGARGEEVRLRAREVAAMGMSVLAAKLGGMNVEVATRALKASTKNLVSVSSTTVAREVMRFTNRLVMRTFDTVIDVIL
jgi:hypothetical protein